MSFIENIKNRAKLDKKTIVLPETMDIRIMEATEKILKEDLADIILIGKEEEINKISQGFDISKATIPPKITGIRILLIHTHLSFKNSKLKTSRYIL